MKLHPVVVDIDQAVVGDGHAMRISAHVIKHLLRPGEGAFGVDHPFVFLSRPATVAILKRMSATETPDAYQSVWSRLFIPEIIDSATSMG